MMKGLIIIFLLAISLLSLPTFAQVSSAGIIHHPITLNQQINQETTPPEYSQEVQQLIANALSINKQHLKYKFGSDDPRNGGMDCSGTIHYLLKNFNLDVPRQANEIYQWAWLKGKFYGVNAHHLNSFEFSKLKPGDLLFWTDTYHTHRDPPITHVMLYLGKNQFNKPIMFGASTSHHYHGKLGYGVGVYDFDLNDRNAARFIGYSCIPDLNC